MNEHSEAETIRTIILLFSRMNASILLGQIECIVQNNSQIKLLEQGVTERMGLGLLVLECRGDVPGTLMYELGFSTLLMDYAIYEPNVYKNAWKDGQHVERT